MTVEDIINKIFPIKETTWKTPIERFAGFLENVDRYLGCCDLHKAKLQVLSNELKEYAKDNEEQERKRKAFYKKWKVKMPDVRKL